MREINITNSKQESYKQSSDNSQKSYIHEFGTSNDEFEKMIANIDHPSSLDKTQEDDPNNESFIVEGTMDGDRSWECTFEGCDKSFKFRCRLEKHKITHSEERPFVCSESGCGKSYRRIDHLRVHAVAHGEDSKPFKCLVDGCESKFSLKNHLMRHKREQHEVERPFKCNIRDCNQSFTQDYLLRSHMTIHTGKRPYPCEHPECTKSFSSSTKLRDHERIHSGQKRWRCAFQGCTQDFVKYDQLCKHLRQDHKPICEICNQNVKDFKQLRLHMKTHDPDRLLFPCSWEGCDKYFSSIKSLSIHTKAIHKNIRPFVCEIPFCEMSFAYKKVLTNHIKTIHEQSRQRKIRKLNGDTNTNRSVTDVEHLTGYDYERGRNIKCLINSCKYMFKRNYDLERHLKSFHKDLIEDQETEYQAVVEI
ncbi:15362_t:CDS:2 [Funneliformis geosporum]|uniref:14494_t:CDS:1 n=1 Tax=Funneliformis geosporum TaxID=1117311 RepID=A0A9W4SAX1_9GLOM|nr:14494_t:CDS:2 [Funneliformis geosporum]CAI2164068.1 15362_t:CDS:2 [Funneliformis geosporum]